jgi:hypothetical protein
MIRNTLLRQQRAIAQSLARSSPAQRPFSALSSTIRSPAFSIASLKPARRWQSTDAEKAAEGAKPTEDAAKTEEDPVKKELEAKSKEVVDLKVMMDLPQVAPWLTPCRTSTSDL